jgi:hypothetical protein
LCGRSVGQRGKAEKRRQRPRPNATAASSALGRCRHRSPGLIFSGRLLPCLASQERGSRGQRHCTPEENAAIHRRGGSDFKFPHLALACSRSARGVSMTLPCGMPRSSREK